jgi:hypothetical protein
MKLSEPIIQQERKFFFNTDNQDQEAEIIFEFENQEGLKNTGFWKFKECNFKTSVNKYSYRNKYWLEDFEFLSLVYNKIELLLKELNN